MLSAAAQSVRSFGSRAAANQQREGGTVNPLKAIRAKCLDCVCYQPTLVAECHIVTCALHPFRMGKNPFRKIREITDADRAALSLRLAPSRRVASPVLEGQTGERGGSNDLRSL